MLKSSISKSKTQPHTTGHKTRVCNNCNERKAITRYELKKQRWRARECLDCRSAGKRKRLSNSPHLYISNLYTQLAYRRRETHDYEITREYLYGLYERQKGICAYSGVAMTNIKDGTGYHLSNISIDRIDNTKGYLEGNIALVCLACNMMKYTLDLKDMKNWCKMITQHNED